MKKSMHIDRFLAALLSLSAIACQPAPRPSAIAPSPSASPAPKLQVLSQSDVFENGRIYVVGQARAIAFVSYAQLSFGVLDKSGNRIGTAIANISNLTQGQTWNYRAPILQESADRVTPPVVVAD